MKLKNVALAIGIGVLAALGGAGPALSSEETVKNIVLVHGAFADGSSWSKVIPILESRGFHVTAVQNPLSSLSDDAKATRRILAQQDGPAILVGHSWGGAVITEVGEDPGVAGLVYVAAYAPDKGESAGDVSAPFGKTAGQKCIRLDAEQFASISEEGVLSYFAEGLPMPQRRLVSAVQGQTYAPMFSEKLTHAGWRSKPSWHVVATKDQTLTPAMERANAAKANGKSIEIPTCHLAMLQEPEKVADLISEAARDAIKKKP